MGDADLRKGWPLVEDRQHVRVRRLHRRSGEEAMIRRALACLVAGAGVSASAQRAPACAKPSQTAAWMLVQKQTLSEEAGAWKNDSLRKGLMKAANLRSASVAPQLGWEVQG